VTSRKTDEDLAPPKREGPEIKGQDLDEKVIAQLKKNYPKAREIEKLPSGNYAVRFRRKNQKTVYWKKH